MILPFIKKDLLILLRNRQEILVLVLMPIAFIAILGFALSGFMNGETIVLEPKVAIVHHGDESKEQAEFKNIVETSNLPDEAKVAILQGADQLTPVKTLIEDVLGSDELKDLVQVEVVEPSRLEQVINDDQYAAVIEIPEQFTLTLHKKILLDEPVQTTLQLYKNEGSQIGSSIIEDVVNEYQNQFATMTILGKAGVQIDGDNLQQVGKIETLTEKDPINAKQYYAVGMSVMFILFIASNMSDFANKERQQHVFNRIILSNVSRWSYFSGIFVSTFLIAALQQGILYGVSAIAFGVLWDSFGAFLVLNLALCFAVSGLAVLLTSINFKLNSDAASTFFSTTLVAIFAFLGGSFTPIADLSSFINVVGNLTPNGTSMTALLQLLQGANLGDVLNHVIYLLLLGAGLLIIGVLSFPKRGEAI